MVAEKQEKKLERETVPQEKSVEETPSTQAAVTKSAAPWPFITIGVFVSVVVLAVVVVAWAGMAVLLHTTMDETTGYERYDRGGYSNDGNLRERTPGGMRGMSSVVASGVVTAIDGDAITVSGRGEQVKVTKFGDTFIGGDKANLEVNDTVIVTGDVKEDGSVTATRIIIRNQAPTERTYDSPRRMPNI